MSVRRIQSRASRFFLAFVALIISTASLSSPLSATEPRYDPRAYLEAKLLYHAVMSCATYTGVREISNADARAGRIFSVVPGWVEAEIVEGLYLASLTGSPMPDGDNCNYGSTRIIQAALRVWNLDNIMSLLCNFEDPTKPGLLYPSQSGANCSDHTGTWILRPDAARLYLRDTFLSQRFNQDGLSGTNWPHFTEEQKFYLFSFTLQSSASACQVYTKIVDTLPSGADSREVV